VPHSNLSRNCRRVIFPKLTRRFPILFGNVEYAQRVMETELDPNLPNRTRTLAPRFDHPNSSSIVTPDGLTLPESPPPGERAREWPGVAPFGAAWGSHPEPEIGREGANPEDSGGGSPTGGEVRAPFGFRRGRRPVTRRPARQTTLLGAN
jgi:hypothetical protein